jgi:hypothetical protein
MPVTDSLPKHSISPVSSLIDLDQILTRKSAPRNLHRRRTLLYQTPENIGEVSFETEMLTMMTGRDDDPPLCGDFL